MFLTHSTLASFVRPATRYALATRILSTVNKQLGDKERVAAALENQHLMAVVNKCTSPAATAGSLDSIP